MGRANVIDGLVEQLRQTNGFDAVSHGTAVAYDHRVLSMGVDRAAIVLANQGELTAITFDSDEASHDLDVEMYIRHNNDIVQARRDADVYLDNIITRINENYTLGGSAFYAGVTRYQVEDEKFVVGKVAFLKEVITVQAKETATTSE